MVLSELLELMVLDGVQVVLIEDRWWLWVNGDMARVSSELVLQSQLLGLVRREKTSLLLTDHGRVQGKYYRWERQGEDMRRERMVEEVERGL